jgi:hypothetical protein
MKRQAVEKNIQVFNCLLVFLHVIFVILVIPSALIHT